MDPTRARQRSVRRLIKQAFYIFLTLGILASLVWAWLPKPLPVETATASRGPMQVTVDEDGQARIKDRYIVSAPLFGSMARIELDPGDIVTQGQDLVQIEPVQPALLDARARAAAEARLAQTLAAQRQSAVQIERSQAVMDLAQSELQRAKDLFQREAGSRQTLELAENNVRRVATELASLRFGTRIARFEVDMARAALERMPGERGPTDSKRIGDRAAAGNPAIPRQLKIPSPVSGRVLRIFHKSEGVVQPGTQLLEVGDPSALQVVVDVLTSDAALIERGAEVTLDRWGGPPVAGRVRRVEPSAFTRMSALGVEEQRVNVLIDLTSPPETWSKLGDGYRVEARIVVWKHEDVVRVPASSVFRHGDGWALFRLDQGVIRLTPVVLGQRTNRDVQIERGVQGGELVIIHPGDQVIDGRRGVPR